jgi:hypothetical protein
MALISYHRGIRRIWPRVRDLYRESALDLLARPGR